MAAGRSNRWRLYSYTQIKSPPREEVSKIGKAEEPQVKRMNLNVPVELHNAFKSTTAAQGQSMTDVLLEFIQQYVTKHSSSTKRRRS